MIATSRMMKGVERTALTMPPTTRLTADVLQHAAAVRQAQQHAQRNADQRAGQAGDAHHHQRLPSELANSSSIGA
jgi:hypothetical protein